jgi:hypothetical protein
MPQKPIGELTRLERLQETVALQRLRASSGMEGSTRVDLVYLRERSATGPILYSFRNTGDPWKEMILYYAGQAVREYDKLSVTWGRDFHGFQKLMREKGLSKVPEYKREVLRERPA